MDRKITKKEKNKKEDQALIKFLVQTKNGEYAEIETSSLDYVRVPELTYEPEEIVYYGIHN